MTSPRPSEPRTGHQLYHGAPLALATAIKLTAAAIATIYATQLILVSLGTAELAASAIADIVVIAGVVAYARARQRTLADLGVRRTHGRFAAAAILIGLSAWYLTLLLVYLIQPHADSDKLQELVKQTALVPTVVTLTILPAIAEELVFRGVLLRALADRLFPGAAIAVSALVFGAYHLNPPQIVSTFALGLLLGYLTLRARSILPAMIVHILNNTIAIVLSRDEVPAASEWLGAHPYETLVGATILLTCGVALAAKEAA